MSISQPKSGKNIRFGHYAQKATPQFGNFFALKGLTYPQIEDIIRISPKWGGEKMNNQINVFNNINAEIKRRGITKETMCQDVGISRRTFTNWQAKGDLPSSALLKCAEYFNCSTDYLLGLSNQINLL